MGSKHELYDHHFRGNINAYKGNCRADMVQDRPYGKTGSCVRSVRVYSPFAVTARDHHGVGCGSRPYLDITVEVDRPFRALREKSKKMVLNEDKIKFRFDEDYSVYVGRGFAP